MKRISYLAVTLLLVAAACSGSSGSTTTTTRQETSSSTTTPGSLTIPTFPDDDEEIGIDPDVRIGVLDNGLTYYIRENTAPGRRAQLRLIVKAGSAHEDPDQHGVAHYLEHMMFNGTERFPANELVLVLERFGADFGPDINAYTSYEETVYEIALATDDPEIVETAFDVLEQWASAATLDPVEVDLERGVLLEEWRLRDQQFEGRYDNGVGEILFAGTPYEGQDPLADETQLDATTPETLRRFYEDWYRPDLMAVVAVGDFDADEIEQLIRDRFGPLEGPPDPRDPPDLFTTPLADPAFFVLADPEYTEAWAETNYPVPAEEGGTVGAQRRWLTMELAFSMLATRLDENVRRSQADFFNAGRAANPFVRTQVTTGLFANAEPKHLATAIEALLTEAQRGLEHGFGQGELDRARDALLRTFELAYEERGTKQDHQWASDYVEHFLGGQPIPSAKEWLDLNTTLLEEMTVDQVSKTFAAVMAGTQPFVIIVVPEGAGDDIPTEAELAAIVERVASTPTEARPDETGVAESLMDPPDAARVAERGSVPGTIVPMITLDNGARIAFLPTEIRQGVVVFGAWSPGGWSLLPEGDVTEARLAPRMVVQSGIADLDQVELDRFLATRFVNLFPFVDETEEGFFGEAQVDDLEVLLQLVHLYMTEPRLDETARDLVLDGIRPAAENPESDPDTAVTLAIQKARYRGDDRYLSVPPLGDIDTFDSVRALEVFGERFGDASDFVFAFSGDFDPVELERLVRRYIGTIPGAASGESWAETQPTPPDGVTEVVVEAGTGVLGGVTFLFSSEVELDAAHRAQIAVLERIVRQRLTERIREQLSATYSPRSVLSIRDEPREGVEAFIDISGDPEGLDEVSDEVLADLADLRANGPTDDQLAIAQEQLVRDYQLESNESLTDTLLFYMGHPDEDIDTYFNRIPDVIAVTAAQVAALARVLFPADRYIEVRLVPEAFGG